MPSSGGRRSIRITFFHIHIYTSATCQKRSKKVAVDDTDDDKRGGEEERGCSTILNKRMDIFATLVSLAN